MKTWDIVISTVLMGYSGPLYEAAEMLVVCLDHDAVHATVAGDLESGQLDVHFEWVGVDSPSEAAAHALTVLGIALERVNTTYGRKAAAEVVEFRMQLMREGGSASMRHLQSSSEHGDR